MRDIKLEGVLRILSINLHGFGLDKIEKVVMLKEVCEAKKIEYYLFSFPDRRWTVPVKEKTEYEMLIILDSRDDSLVTKTWLLDGTISMV